MKRSPSRVETGAHERHAYEFQRSHWRIFATVAGLSVKGRQLAVGIHGEPACARVDGCQEIACKA